MHIPDALSMEHEAARFVSSLSPRLDEATVVTLSGELGAGKTAFVKGVAKALGVTEHVTSPTFVIMKKYPLEHALFSELIHIDAYRLKGAHHLRILGWEELIKNPRNLVCIEWPEHADTLMPKSAIRLTLRYSGDNEREITYEENGTQTTHSS